MVNMIRADMYRIFRGKALYITLAVLLASIVLTVASTHALQTGFFSIEIPSEEVPQMAQQVSAFSEGDGVSGISITTPLATSMENFVFFLLPIVIVVAGAIFSHGTVKNDLAWGVSRTKLYFSKLILASILCILMIVFYYVFGILIATIWGGFGGPAPDGHWIGLLQIIAAQLVLLLAYVAFGVFLAFATRRTAAVNGAFIAFVFVPMFLLMILAIINSNLERLLDFEMLSNLINLARLPYLEAREILRALGIGVFVLVASTVGGIALFKRAEIK